MKAWLMDAYRKEKSIVLWIKTPERDFRIEKPFKTTVYIDPKARHVLEKHEVKYKHVRKRTYMRKYIDVLEVPIPNLNGFEKFILDIERATRHRIPLYNGDIKPEQMFLYKHDLRPCSSIIISNNKIVPLKEEHPVPLKTLWLKVFTDLNSPIKEIKFDKELIKGEEIDILKEFQKRFNQSNPDVIIMEYAYSRLSYLVRRLESFKIDVNFHRWDPLPIKYKGGRSYWSYGQVRYQDYAVRLRGRFLVDTNSFVGTECEPEAVAELAQLSGTLFQQTSSRSFGAAFQTALVREMYRQGFLVPFKEKPIEKPLNMLEMLKADRAGFTFDPKQGFHKDVAEIDFTSMFPWLIYNHNISAECILSEKGPFAHIPQVPIRISMRHKGLIPIALKPFIDRRMYYKKHPSAVNNRRAKGLKWVLVSCYGYLRFREFKLGLPTSHMAIGALSRETLLEVIHLAEERGFEVVHGIVDCLYIRKLNLKEEEVKDFCREIEMITGIPVHSDGIFKWIVFLPSVLDKDRSLPSTYYGVFRHGDIKARGIEVRQRSVPVLVKLFQEKILNLMKDCSTKKEIVQKVPELCRYLRYVIKNIANLDKDYLTISIRIAQTEYVHNIPQKIIVEKLNKKGIKMMPGQFIHYIYQQNAVVLPEEYNGKPNVEQYKRLLIRALFIVLQPFGSTKESIIELAEFDRQTRIIEFVPKIKYRYIPMSKKYSSNYGLSEKLIKKRLERNGWTVFRGSGVDILRRNDENYPNVVRKYSRLMELLQKYHPDALEYLQYLNHVHHGMPDYLCYRNKVFMFVECKFQYESLSEIQKKCIYKLMELGFDVEVHKIVDHRTKVRKMEIIDGEKIILEKQMVIR